MAAMCRRLAKGIEVTDASIALDLIREIAPRGTGYFTASQTLERLRSLEYFFPRLAVRGSRAAREAAGCEVGDQRLGSHGRFWTRDRRFQQLTSR
jgi:trimethylamine:corrinoid methyltransferase-like protein